MANDNVDKEEEKNRITIALGIVAFAIVTPQFLPVISNDPVLAPLWIALIAMSMFMGAYLFLLAVSLTPGLRFKEVEKIFLTAAHTNYSVATITASVLVLSTAIISLLENNEIIQTVINQVILSLKPLAIFLKPWAIIFILIWIIFTLGVSKFYSNRD